MPEQDDTRLSLGSQTPLESRLDQLRELFPEAFTEGKLDLAKLRLALGESVAAGPERYGLSWAGKAEAIRSVQIPSVGTLVPARDESVDFDTTENLFIEGDNLEVLKLLQKSYFGRIKMIYIDPPYNTGNDFIYPDNYCEGLNDYLLFVGQLDDEGRITTTNPEESGRYHSKWLSMIYPRLFLARNLLSDNGILFISIDDHESHNLRSLLDELFGQENFVGQIVWKSRRSEDTRAKTGLSTDHEYILCYRKTDLGRIKGAEKDISKFDNPDNDERGPWRSADLTGLASKERRPNLHYDLIDPDTGVNYGCPPKGWRFDPATMSKKIAKGRILWPDDPSGRPRHKLFQNEMDSIFKNLSSVIVDINTSNGTRETNELLGENIFDFPKPSQLLERLVDQVVDSGGIVLDFFAGSCPIAQSVLSLNEKDAGRRNFIVVQLPEPTAKGSSARAAGYKTIADIGKARIHRVGEIIKRRASEELEYADRGKLDLGVKVFNLSPSNFKIWDSDKAPHDAKGLAQQLRLFADHLLPGSKDESILYELILKSGLPLTAKVETKTVAGQTVYAVEGEAGQLAVCLEDPISQDTLRGMMELRPAQVLCLDHAFRQNDQLKTNIVLEMKSHGIQFRTV